MTITITSEMLSASNKKIKKVWLKKAHQEIQDVLYAMGRKEPRYPLPAIPVTVEWHGWSQPDPFHGSVTWMERRQFCDCGGLMYDLVAIVDYNWDRCMDFSYRAGVYVAGQELEDGIALYMEGMRVED